MEYRKSKSYNRISSVSTKMNICNRYILKIFFIIVCILLFNLTYSQTQDNKFSLPSNSVSFEFLGNAYAIGSITYERIFCTKNNIYLVGHVGVGAFYFMNKTVVSIPVLTGVIFHLYKRLSLEGTAGVSFFIQNAATVPESGLDPVITGFFGIRLQHPYKGFCFRAGFTPFYDLKSSPGPNMFERNFVSWVGVSFGHSF